jgi:hypothetical protein
MIVGSGYCEQSCVASIDVDAIRNFHSLNQEELLVNLLYNSGIYS